jgi:carboxyl-terminal processing protease
MSNTVHGDTAEFRTGRGVTLQRFADRAAELRVPASELRAKWYAAYNNGIRQTVLHNRFSEASNGKVVWGRIGTDIGYINLSAVEGFTSGGLAENIRFVNELMDRILTEFDGVKAVILDITHNTGGYDRLAREIVGHFTPERRLAYSKRAFGAKEVEPDVFYAEPSAGRRFTGPAYLMTSDITASGGEILAMTMRVLPNVTQIGTSTRGALSDRLVKVMPDGFRFSISNEIYLDPQGKSFEAIGVPPHRSLPVFPADNSDAGHSQAVAEVVKLIRSSAAARSTP